MRSSLKETFRKAAAGCLTAVMCITSLSTNGSGKVFAAGTPAERADTSIVYFVDCGDYVVNTVSEGDQLGTHNSVTDQVYGADAVTGYEWGIVDTVSDPPSHGICEKGGVTTDNTWPFEYNEKDKDYPKTVSNRYTRDQPAATRHLEYAFEMESGNYQVTVGCVNPWNNADSPTVTATLESDTQNPVILGENLSIPQWGCTEAAGKVTITGDSDKLRINIRGAGGNDKCVNVGYILIESEEAIVKKDKASLALPEIAWENLTLPVTGANGSSIAWNSSDENVIATDGTVHRPVQKDGNKEITLTAAISYGTVIDTKEFLIKVPSVKTSPVLADRTDPSVIYFVDCGDYVVNTVSEGDQLGTHNGVTDQPYGEDYDTGYYWGIADTVSEPLLCGTHPCGGAFTDNTWPYESNAANKDTDKISSNRYAKDQSGHGITERFVDYKFQLESGTYEITVCCVNPWGVSNAPKVFVKQGSEGAETETVLADALEVAKGANGTVTQKVELEEGNQDLTVCVHGIGAENDCVNVAYILIRSVIEGETEDEAAVRRDKEELTLEDVTKADLILPSAGKNGSIITWESSQEEIISNTGKVNRPVAGIADAVVTMTAHISYGTAEDTKEFQVTVLAMKVPAPVVRDDNTIAYFVDCGDYVVNTVNAGDQFGTHNSVTDQVYQDDNVTGYHWGIIDTVSEPLRNGMYGCGGVFTDNTWPYESNPAKEDIDKISSNRYAKNQSGNGIEERFVDYAFELESGIYEVTVCCVNPWGVSNEPKVFVKQGSEDAETETVLAEALTVTRNQSAVVTKLIELAEGNDKLTVCVHGTGTKNDCVNVAYMQIKEHKHEVVKKEIKAATCTEAGSIEHWECSSCGWLFEDEEGKKQISAGSITLAPLGHDFSKKIIEDAYQASAATCMAPASYYYACSRCDDKGTDTYSEGEKLPHMLEKTEAKAATCTEAGNIAYWKCTSCENLFADEAGSEPTDVEHVLIAALGHNYSDVVNNGDGTHSAFCIRCNTRIQNEAHIWGEGETETAATCTAPGTILYTCTVCQASKSEPIAALGHDFTKKVMDEEYQASAATCITAASYYYACSRCDAKGTNTYTEGEKAPHSLTKTSAAAATCATKGNREYWRCTVCSSLFADEACSELTIEEEIVIAALGHDFTKKVMDEEHQEAAATCMAFASYYYSCSRCDAKGTSTFTGGEKAPHTLKKTEASAATCTTAGNREYWNCTVCDSLFADEAGSRPASTESITIAASGHSYGKKLMKATTAKDGSIAEVCSICGDSKNSVVINRIDKLSLKTSQYTYTGKARKPAVTVKDSKGNDISSENYIVSYKNNKKVGRASVTVTFTGNYQGEWSKTFDIIPKGTSITKVRAARKGFKVTWKKQKSQTSGYQIQYSASRKFTKKTTKLVPVNKNGTTAKSVSKLKAKKKYYVRIRTYSSVKVNGKTVKFYSGWSKVKTVTTKK